MNKKVASTIINMLVFSMILGSFLYHANDIPSTNPIGFDGAIKATITLCLIWGIGFITGKGWDK
jgi:hypothetical protein